MSDLYRCLNCNEVISITYNQCRFCAVPVDPHRAQQAVADFAKLNQACSIANGFRASNYALLGVFVVGTVWWMVTGFAGNARLPIATQIVPGAMLVTAVAWFFKYNTLQVRDPDYPEAKETMKTSVRIWGVVFAFQAMLWVYIIARVISSVNSR